MKELVRVGDIVLLVVAEGVLVFEAEAEDDIANEEDRLTDAVWDTVVVNVKRGELGSGVLVMLRECDTVVLTDLLDVGV